MSLISDVRGDTSFYYSLLGEETPKTWFLRVPLVPSLYACLLFRLASETTGMRHLLVKRYLLRCFGCVVASGADIRGPIRLPHPTGIVIGEGVVIGHRVQIFQHVTLGRDGKGDYPIIGDDVILFTGAVVAGAVTVPNGARIGALQFVRPSPSSS